MDSRRLFRQPPWVGLLGVVLLLPWTARGTAQQADEPTSGQNRYNVLFVAIDDLRPELGCYGVPHARTLHLDSFAKTALRFTRHYVQVATCGSSRYALLTGRSPRSTGLTGGNDGFHSGSTALSQRKLPGAQTMPELFRRSGYRTSLIGKISHTADGRVYAYNGTGDGRLEVPHAWDDMLTPMGSWKRGWGVFFAYPGGVHREDGSGRKDLMDFTAVHDDDLPDGQMATAAIKHLQVLSQEKQPFFLGLGFFKPHLPFVAPKQDWDALADIDIPLPPAWKIDSPYWHRSNEFYKYDMPFPKDRPLSEEAHRNAIRAYGACVRYVDRQLGRLLIALDELELSQNTIVVVWGDHGWHLGEQQIWAKHTPFERANNSVLMIRVPGMSTAGKSTSSLVESIDLYPTLVELCSLTSRTTRYPLDGKSLVPILRHERSTVHTHATSYWRDAVSVRTTRHRLVAKMEDGKPTHIELYDLSSGPDSVRDLSQTEPELVKRLLALLPQD